MGLYSLPKQVYKEQNDTLVWVLPFAESPVL